MYLITVEGGDGSGKGLATQMIAEILQQEFTFAGVDVTAEPRRNAELGLMAVEAVRTGEAGPVREAVYFAADRMDHSHTWIRPRLSQGRAVVSERNIHSSLVYQGVVGDLGIEEVAEMNAAAMIPDLCVWVDCDPSAALRRIEQSTLRVTLNKSEYFETDEYQVKIRQGYHDLLGGKVPMPEPFDKGRIVGPIVNDGTKEELRKKLQFEIRRFLHERPSPPMFQQKKSNSTCWVQPWLHSAAKPHLMSWKHPLLAAIPIGWIPENHGRSFAIQPRFTLMQFRHRTPPLGWMHLSIH